MNTIRHRRIIELSSIAKKTIKKFSRVIEKDLDSVHKEFIGLHGKTKKEHFFAMLFLKSTIPTIKIVAQFISIGHYDEALVLERMILEKAALVFKGLKDNLSTKEIEKLQGNRCITFLKEYFDIGKIYGGQSEIAHSKPVPYIHFAILKFYDNKKTKNTDMATDEIGLTFNIRFCYVMEALLAVSKFLSKEYLKGNSGWKLLANNKWDYKSVMATKFGSLPDSLWRVYELYIEGLK